MYKIWNNFKTSLLLSALIGLCLAVGYLLGGWAALLPALAVGAAMNFFAFFFSDKIALATMRAVEISPHDDPATDICQGSQLAHEPRRECPLSASGRCGPHPAVKRAIAAAGF